MMLKKIFLVISVLFCFSVVGRVNAEEKLEYNHDDFSIVGGTGGFTSVIVKA